MGIVKFPKTWNWNGYFIYMWRCCSLELLRIHCDYRYQRTNLRKVTIMRRKSRCGVIQQWKLESAHRVSGTELYNKIHFFLNYIEPNVFPNRNLILKVFAATLSKIKTEGDESDLPRRVFVVERREIS